MVSFFRYCLAFAFISLSACNHLFYHPSEQTFTTPDKFDLQSTAYTVETPDGETLSFWHINAKAPKVGTVLHFHGNAENMTSHFLFLAWITHFGFDVVTFDYRGYGASSGVPTRAGLVIDGVTAIRHLDKIGDPFFVVAQSLGGAVAIPAIVKADSQYLRGLVVESSFASYRDIARHKLANIWLTWPLQYPLSWLVSNDLNPLEYADNIEVPTVVIHADADPVVEIEHGRALFAAMGAEQKDFWRIEGGGHTVAFPEANSPLREKLVDFFCSHSAQPDGCRALKRQRLKAIE